MSKMAWERAAGSAARLATVSVIAAFAATTSVAANSAAPVKAPTNAQGAKVPASYGQTTPRTTWGQPQFGAPQFGAPAFGQPQHFGAPQFGAPQFGAPQFAPQFGAPQFGQSPLGRPQIAPATTSTFDGTAAPAGTAPQFPARTVYGQPPMQQQPQFGQRLPIFANTQANGITYGPPSYTKPKDFDPKMASSSPFPASWGQAGWGQQQLPQQPQFQGRIPAPSLAGAPVYGGQWGQRVAPASASQFAPAEPTYAPAEPLRPNYATAPAPAQQFAPAQPAYAPAQQSYAPAAPATYESVDVTPAAPAMIEAAPAPASTQTYTYPMATSTSTPAYVGQSTQIGETYAPATSASPLEVVIGQSGQITNGFEAAPTTYEQAPAYQPAPAYQQAPAYDTSAAPAYQTEAPVYESQASAYEAQAGGYEMTTTEAPVYQAATSYSTPGYEGVTAAPAYEQAPAYETATSAPAYGLSGSYGSSSFSSGNGHFVQVGAFRNVARAERLVRKLQGAGEQPIVTQATVRGKLYHRVRVPAMDKRDAANVQSRIRGLGYYEARMVRG